MLDDGKSTMKVEELVKVGTKLERVDAMDVIDAKEKVLEKVKHEVVVFTKAPFWEYCEPFMRFSTLYEVEGNQAWDAELNMAYYDNYMSEYILNTGMKRISHQKTENKEKMTKPGTEWKSCKGQSQSKAKDQKSQSQSQLNKLTVKTGAVIEEYYWLQSQPI
ncbi:hypothetical protein Tco_0006397 [Tanacetum coccineum]